MVLPVATDSSAEAPTPAVPFGFFAACPTAFSGRRTRIKEARPAAFPGRGQRGPAGQACYFPGALPGIPCLGAPPRAGAGGTDAKHVLREMRFTRCPWLGSKGRAGWRAGWGRLGVCRPRGALGGRPRRLRGATSARAQLGAGQSPPSLEETSEPLSAPRLVRRRNSPRPPLCSQPGSARRAAGCREVRAHQAGSTAPPSALQAARSPCAGQCGARIPLGQAKERVLPPPGERPSTAPGGEEEEAREATKGSLCGGGPGPGPSVPRSWPAPAWGQPAPPSSSRCWRRPRFFASMLQVRAARLDGRARLPSRSPAAACGLAGGCRLALEYPLAGGAWAPCSRGVCRAVPCRWLWGPVAEPRGWGAYSE